MRTVRVGSRDSKLALIQTKMVLAAIKSYDSTIKTEIIKIKTTGDKILNKPLDKIGGKGLFVKELDEALLEGKVDITVHSYKDLPMEFNKELPIVALSEREDERDVLILPKGHYDEKRPLGCSSKRRIIQLKNLGFDHIKPLRGNVITRLEKLDSGYYSGLVLAAAGIKRLGLGERISSYFTVDEILPAACQGIIAVQGRKGEDFPYLKKFNNIHAKVVSLAERAFVKELDGGCSSPVGAYAYFEKDVLYLKGLYVDEGTNLIIKGEDCSKPKEAAELGIELAKRLKGEMK